MKRKHLSCDCSRDTQCNSDKCPCYSSKESCTSSCGCGNLSICRMGCDKKVSLAKVNNFGGLVEKQEGVWKRYYYEHDDELIYFGIKQLDCTEFINLEYIQEKVLKMFDSEWKKNTRDSLYLSSKNNSRVLVRDKFFFPKYSYGDSMTPKSGMCKEIACTYCRVCKGKQEIITEDCDDIPKWIHKYVVRPLVKKKIIADEWINEVVLNVYHTPSAGLAAHFDSPHLFSRPILSLRLFEKAELIFGSSHLSGGKDSFRVKIPVGTLTIMEGDAANLINHAVSRGRKKMSASILMRHVLDEWFEGTTWLERNCKKVFSKPTQCTIKKMKYYLHEHIQICKNGNRILL